MMSIKNTKPNKIKFLALYLDQAIAQNHQYIAGKFRQVVITTMTIHNIEYIVLKNPQTIQKDQFEDYQLADKEFLRSQGYAAPWLGLSIEQQIQYGWIKLKSDDES